MVCQKNSVVNFTICPSARSETSSPTSLLLEHSTLKVGNKAIAGLLLCALHQFSTQIRGRMEKPSDEVVLFGTWASSFCTRVALALKLKGVPYEYVEEDLSNKSQLLLRYNPVHKKVPVLVHNGVSLSESLVILEYIDEQWPNSPKLLPSDPTRRAKERFWAKFYDEKIIPAWYPIVKFRGKERERAIEDFSELCKVMEEGIERDLVPGKSSFFSGGDDLGFLDIVVGTNACCYRALHEALAVAVFDPKKHPKILSWVSAMKEHPLMEGTLPPHDKLVAKLREINSISSQV